MSTEYVLSRSSSIEEVFSLKVASPALCIAQKALLIAGVTLPSQLTRTVSGFRCLTILVSMLRNA